MARRPSHGYGVGVVRPTVLALAKILMLTFSSALAAPLQSSLGYEREEEPSADGANKWVLFGASVVLVLTGGAFAGLTIAYVHSIHPVLRMPSCVPSIANSSLLAD